MKKDDASETSAFEEWLEQTADSTGRDREEVLEQMVSSYWTLKEIVGLVGRADDSDLGVGETPPGALEESRLPASGERPIGEEFAHLRATVSGLEERLAELERSVDAESDESASMTELRSSIEEASSLADEASERQESLRVTLAEEFDSLRLILEYLLDATDGLERRGRRFDESIAELTDRIDRNDDATAEMERHVADHETLVGLTDRANEAGVNEADCGNCGTSLHVALLRTPRCPNCEAEFTGVERSRGLLFASNTLTVANKTDDGPRRPLTWDERK